MYLMKKGWIAWLMCAFMAGGIAACQHEKELPQPGGPGPGNPGGNDTGLCFERDILPIFISNCAKAGCHDAASAQEGYVFTSYQTIVAKKFEPGDPNDTELYEKITENDPDKIMPPPPNAPLSSAQKSLIREWILRGAPNTTGCAPNCDSNNIAFAAGIQPLLNQYCKGCHNSVASSGGVKLDHYSGVAAVVSNGKLLGVIKHQPGFPAMPQGGNKLTDCQIRQVEKWIAAGALNN